MAEEVKFTEEEMNSLKDIQDKYVNIQTGLGQVSMAKLKLNKQLEMFEISFIFHPISFCFTVRDNFTLFK